ncbi:universal stress protein [Aminobacter sp. AP02]|uniref:universal stress protein n=1 Tax=Aminobacter sp. AP02 TaxID=2135737 RepID=UPI000D6D6FE0|nr:universal stress protein [Aminobacter sp. AP02]PWK60308.1 nucleotide-binding universal stress UspA family protein [Aminobacter sp. AP02]
MYTHILITTDGSVLAQKGVEHGLTLAKNLGSKATVITVTDPYPLNSPATMASWSEAQTRHAEAALNLAKETAEKFGVNVDVIQDSDDSPAEAIVKTAHERGCNLIVMASHGRRGVGRLLLGSQTAEVVHYSTIPVLVVR